IDCLITDREKESKTILLEYLRDIISNNEIELLCANHFSERNVFFDDLQNGLNLRCASIYQQGIMWVSNIRDKKTGEKRKLNSARTEAKLRSRDRKIQKHFNDELEVKEIKSLDEIKYFIDKASAVAKESYHNGLQVGIEQNDYWEKMLNSFVSNKFLQAFLLLNNGTPLAYAQGVVFKDSYYGFSTSHISKYNKLSLGIFLHRKVNEILISQKINYVHFGYGDAAYKKMFATHSHEEGIFRIYSCTTKARFISDIDFISNYTNRKINSVLLKTGFLDKAKKMWRTHLEKNKK
ncbi:MAG: GNAT family N-acetyltransferase, partial [Melioribacteraceae bacterium]